MTPGSTKRKRVRARSQRRATAELRRADQVRIEASRTLRYESPVTEHYSGTGRNARSTTVANPAKKKNPARGSKTGQGPVTEATGFVGNLMQRMRRGKV
jgi:hypothetical protein